MAWFENDPTALALAMYIAVCDVDRRRRGELPLAFAAAEAFRIVQGTDEVIPLAFAALGPERKEAVQAARELLEYASRALPAQPPG